MNKEKLHAVIHDLAEQKAPGGAIDLWPAIQSRVQMSQSIYSKGNIMNPHINPQRRRLKPAFVLLAVVLTGALALVLPQGAALAEQALHFFYRGANNIMPGVTVTAVPWVEQTPGVAAPTATQVAPSPVPTPLALQADCGALSAPHCSIDQVRQRVSFPVFALPALPENMVFVGATGESDKLLLTYGRKDGANFLMIHEEPVQGSGAPLAVEVGAAAEIQSVQVGAVSAEYVRGGYDGNENPPVWSNDIEAQMLRWVDQGVMVTVILGAQEPGLDRDGLISLAASLTSGPVGDSGLPSPDAPALAAGGASPDMHALYPLTLADAQSQAGFSLLSPSRLPETFTFVGAAYDATTKVVRLFYSQAPDGQGGLVVSEQLAADGSSCDLCGFVQGDGSQVGQYPTGKLVSREARIETVSLGDRSGQYLEGIGWVAKDNQNGWQWDPSDYRKTVRLQAGKLAIELWADSDTLTREDFLAIVQSLK